SRIGPVDYAFVGNIGARYQRHFIHSIRPQKIIAVDDGLSTLDLVQRRTEGRLEGASTSSKRRTLEYLMGAKFGPLPSIIFYTAYDVEPPPGDRVVKNEYSHLRAGMSEKRRSDDLFILGSPMPDFGLVSADCYLNYL